MNRHDFQFPLKPRHEVPLYRAGLLAISGLMTLIFTWILFQVLKPGARP